MKCPHCGAEIGNTKFCEYCGSQITSEMQQELEQLNKAGCPKCGSSNITFKRENQGEISGKNSKQVIHRTVGMCKDCGATWYADSVKKKRKTWLWVLGWIFIFPVPLTIILLNKKNMKPALKYTLIAVAWVVYLLLAFSGNSGNSNTNNSIVDTNSVVSGEAATQSAEIVTQEATTIVTTTEEAVPAEYKSALIKAQMYSDTLFMSKKGIYNQLTSEYGEQFSKEAADYAIERVDADWNENALKKAKSYQETMAMSPAAIHDQLTSVYGEQFTNEEADYAIAHLND